LWEKACPLLLASMLGEMALFQRLSQPNAEWIFLVSYLVDKVTSITPEREVGVGGRGVERGANAVLIVVVEEISRILGSRTC
jgi:hypothetical protein